jgi:hypothetical protein
MIIEPKGIDTLAKTRATISITPQSAAGIDVDIEATSVVSLRHLLVNERYARSMHTAVVVKVAVKDSIREFTYL